MSAAALAIVKQVVRTPHMIAILAEVKYVFCTFDGLHTKTGLQASYHALPRQRQCLLLHMHLSYAYVCVH